jgi:hypothetical protein
MLWSVDVRDVEAFDPPDIGPSPQSGEWEQQILGEHNDVTVSVNEGGAPWFV